MNITQPKYNVKQRFWVARIRNNYYTESVLVDGKKYEREESSYEPYVKEKEIRSININVHYDGSTTINYNCIDVDERYLSLSNSYKEFEIEYLTREEAEEAAKEMARAKNEQEYFEKTTLKD